MNFKDRVKGYLNEEEINEGIKFFKISKKLDKVINKLNQSVLKEPPSNDDEKKFNDDFFKKLALIKLDFVKIENDFAISTDKTEKKSLKTKYNQEVNKIDDLMNFVLKNKKYGTSRYFGNFIEGIKSSAIITLLCLLVSTAVAGTLGTTISFLNNGTKDSNLAGAGIGGIIGFFLGAGIAKSINNDQNMVRKQKQAILMAAQEQNATKSLLQKARAILDLSSTTN